MSDAPAAAASSTRSGRATPSPGRRWSSVPPSSTARHTRTPRCGSRWRAEPARPGRRRHRHRQDQDAAAHGRAAVGARACRSSSPTSRATCPVWRAPGEAGDRVTARAGEVGADLGAGTAYPTEFLSLGGLGSGVPVRATITSFGPTLLAKVLGLNDTQESSLGLVFHYADSKRPGRCSTSRTCARSSATSPVRRGQGRPEGAGRPVHGDGRGHPAQPHRLLRPGRRRVLRRARVRHRRPAAHRRRTAGASSPASSCPPCRTSRSCSRPS